MDMRYQGVVFRAKGNKEDYLQAAQNGDAESQFQLAICLSESMHRAEDFSEVEYWLTQASKQDYVDAYVVLGNCYSNMERTAEALSCFHRAAQLGSSDAFMGIREIYRSSPKHSDMRKQISSLGYLRSELNERGDLRPPIQKYLKAIAIALLSLPLSYLVIDYISSGSSLSYILPFLIASIVYDFAKRLIEKS